MTSTTSPLAAPVHTASSPSRPADRRRGLRDASSSRAVDRFVRPHANRAWMTVTRFLLRAILQGLPLFRRIPLLNRLPPFGGLLRVRDIVLDDADVSRLRAALNQDTSCFVTPNHPEMCADFMLDWVVTAKSGRTPAFWCARDIVNGPLQPFLIPHNVIAHTKDGAGKTYSIDCAVRGDGVLLHPEGDMRWTSDTVSPLFPGTAHLALQALDRASDRPTFVLPVAYRSRFVVDVEEGLHDEMDLIERRLGLPDESGNAVDRRFFALQRHLLSRQAHLHDVFLGDIRSDNFFDQQDALLHALLARQEAKHGIPGSGTVHARINRVLKAIDLLKAHDVDESARDRRVWWELKRLQGFSRDVYGRGSLSQEHLAECLKRVKQELLLGAPLDALTRLVPIPVGPRDIVVRVGEPIDVAAARRAAGSDDEAAAAVTATLHAALQRLVDEIGDAEPSLRAYPNLFA